MANEVTPAEAPAKPAEPVTPPAPAAPAAVEPKKDSTADPKPAEAAPPPPAVPAPAEGKKEEPAPKPDEKPKEVKYDLKLKDGSFLEAADVEQVSAKAKTLGLSPEQAQALLDEKDEARVSFAQKQKSSLAAQSVKWVEDVKSDPELGGDGFNQNVETAKRFVKTFGSDAFRKTLDETGLGNHPELIRTFARAGKALGEDKMIFPGSKVAPESKNMADVFYGGKTKK